ncbi:protein BIG GRAIN 1-like B [Bidens hawaiensis]|uniref:protein BIG GRAIN 1-like B n=1 Tax=Bidens hawaiensis TaxID=980011 RepID=UPI004049A767
MDASASKRFKDNLTFSSTLLDEIYRSIDEQSTVCSETPRKKQSKSVENNSAQSRNRCFNNSNNNTTNNNDDDKRACLYQKLMQNKAYETPVAARSSASSIDRSSMRCTRESFCVNSKAESLYGVLVKPKPIRTGVHPDNDLQVKAKDEGKFVKTKLKAWKIYNELKKVKQPISPGGRLSAFLSSVFTTGNNNKKSNTAGYHTEVVNTQLNRKSTSQYASTCSSASSVLRSCLAKTPPSRGKLINKVQKSVTFCPISGVIDDETDSALIGDNNRNICEVARDLLKKVECDEDEDGKSDSSSDLFELSNLSPIRVHSNQEELPIYATTNLHNNPSIVNNLFM